MGERQSTLGRLPHFCRAALKPPEARDVRAAFKGGPPEKVLGPPLWAALQPLETAQACSPCAPIPATAGQA